jgi:integrase
MHEEYGELDSDYLFVNLWGGRVGRPMTYATVDGIVARTRSRVGFHFTPHQFRHYVDGWVMWPASVFPLLGLAPGSVPAT